MPVTLQQWALDAGEAPEQVRAWVGHLLAGALVTVGHSDEPEDDEPFGGWYVRYAAEVGRAFADWVEASTEALTDLHGVTAAWVEDRDLVLVEGEVDRLRVRHALEAWWHPRLTTWMA